MILKSIPKKINTFTIFTIFICLMFLTSPHFAEGDKEIFYEGEGIFTDVLLSEAAPYISKKTSSDRSHIIRSRMVKVDFQKIFKKFRYGKKSDKILHINLFDDINLFAKISKVVSNRSGSITYIGREKGKRANSIIFTIKDGIMIGNFTKGYKNFVINYVGGEIHEIQETDHSKYGGCDEPVDSYNYDHAVHAHNQKNLNSIKADDGSIIDVMVVYTGRARTGAGGTTAMENLIDQAIAESNTGYSNSSVNPRLNLVHTTEVTYSETGFNWNTCLDRLVGTSDGYIDNVHTLRDIYKADIVVLIVNNMSKCGKARAIMANASTAFCLVSRNCATGNYSFAHEIGHLQGARHDRYVDNTDYSPYTYNHGRTYPTGSWRTIMAYNTACSDSGTSCTRLNYWSNPSIFYSGIATGFFGGAGVGADNHRCLNNTAYTVANFRDSGGGIITYCSSSASNQHYEWIAGVQLGGLNNISGASGYSDFTGTSTNLNRGIVVNFTLTPGFSGISYNENWEIWIDYNQDGTFSASEKVFSGGGSSYVYGSLTVSVAAESGNTRMRVVMQYNTYRNTTCGNFTYGEVEDYTVNIL